MSLPNPNHPPPPYPPGKHIVPPPRPSSPSTSSYRLNHLMLRIKSPPASLTFYVDCLGLHVIFIFNAGPVTIYYLGPRSVTMENMGTAQGLLELYHVNGDEGVEYASGNEYGRGGGGGGGVGFGHVGFTVPDVGETLERVRGYGFEVMKPLGEAGSLESMGLPEGEDVVDGYRRVFRQLAFVRDPDGYWVEIVPQVVKA